MFNQLMILLADAQSAPPPATPDSGSLFSNPLLPLMAVGIPLFYFLFLRPMRRQDQERQALLTNMKKNDRVITSAGIYGKIISVAEKDDEIVVEIDDKVRVKMVKNSILRNITNEEALKEAEAAKKAAKGGKTVEKTPSSTAVTTKEGGA